MYVIHLPIWLRNAAILTRIGLLLILVGLAVPRLAVLIVQLISR